MNINFGTCRTYGTYYVIHYYYNITKFLVVLDNIKKKQNWYFYMNIFIIIIYIIK